MKGGRVGGSLIQTHCWHTHGWRAGTSADAKRCLHCSAPSLPPSLACSHSVSFRLSYCFLPSALSFSPSLSLSISVATLLLQSSSPSSCHGLFFSPFAPPPPPHLANSYLCGLKETGTSLSSWIFNWSLSIFDQALVRAHGSFSLSLSLSLSLSPSLCMLCFICPLLQRKKKLKVTSDRHVYVLATKLIDWGCNDGRWLGAALNDPLSFRTYKSHARLAVVVVVLQVI